MSSHIKGRKQMNKLLVLLVTLIAIIYIRYNMKFNDQYEILQTSSDKMTPSLLFEKSPIVVDTYVENAGAFISSVFRYLHISTSQPYQTSGVKDSNAKYLVISAPKDVVIDVVNPKYKGSSTPMYVSINLYKKQILVLPMYWTFTSSEEVEAVDVHDFFSLVYSKMQSKSNSQKSLP